MISFVSILTVLMISTASNLSAKTKQGYIKKTLAHIHRHPTRDSLSVNLLSCGQKVLLDRSFPKWYFVKSGIFQGYIRRENISMTLPKCVQNTYPRFFELLDLSPSERYHWGKLYDRYEYAHTGKK